MYKLLVKTHEITLFLVIFEYLEAIPHPWLSAFTNPNLNQVPQAAGPVPRHLQERSFATLPSVERREHLWNFHIKNIKKNSRNISLYVDIYIYYMSFVYIYICILQSINMSYMFNIIYIYDMCVWVCRCMYVLYKYIYIYTCLPCLQIWRGLPQELLVIRLTVRLLALLGFSFGVRALVRWTAPGCHGRSMGYNEGFQQMVT